GATRARVIRQLLTESALLAVGGGMAGIVIAFAGIAWLQAVQPPNIPRLSDIGITPGVLLFTAALCVTATILFGLAPALGIGNADLHTSLKDAGRGGAGSQALWGRGGRMRRLLVSGEVALSVILLIGAGLLIRSYAQ